MHELIPYFMTPSPPYCCRPVLKSCAVLCTPWTAKYQASFCWIIEKARKFQENNYFCFIDYAKAFDCMDHNKLWKILHEMRHQTTLSASWEICLQIKKQQLELDRKQQTGSKKEKEYVKDPANLTYMQSTSWETLGWRKHKLEPRLLREISIT